MNAERPTPNNRQELPAIVLAAGLSSRMGAFKPLMELAGKPLLLRVVDGLLESAVIREVVIVAGHRADEIEAALQLWQSKAASPEAGRVRVVRNSDFARGEMLSSVRAGIAALRQHANAAETDPALGFLLAFADQPAVSPATVQQLVAAFNAKKPPLAIPTFLGKRGHPVVFSEQLLPAIAALSPVDTLRSVVHQYLPQALLVAVDDSSILDDLDTPDDFARALANLRAPGMDPAKDISGFSASGGAHG